MHNCPLVQQQVGRFSVSCISLCVVNGKEGAKYPPCRKQDFNTHIRSFAFAVFVLSDGQLVTGGNYNLKVWSFDRANRKLRMTDCNLGQLKRAITSITIDDNDECMYC